MLIGSLIGFRAVPFVPNFPQSALASVVSGGPIAKSPLTPAQGLLLWFFLSVLTALMHSTESAITKISPWKVKQFADEEGPSSPFATLSSDITRLLITILLFTTACSIYKTALFVSTVEKMFPTASLGAITAGL
jgi:CBS domain containing-hemolysin-like protein